MPETDELGHRCDRVVRLHLFSIGLPAVPETTALRNAQRVYGHHRIRLRVLSAQSIRLGELDRLTLRSVDTACIWDVDSDEQQRVHQLGDAAGAGAHDIRVFWVSEIRKPDGSLLAGCASHAPAKPAVMVSAHGTRWTMAHELAHVLLGPSFAPAHTIDTNNLMSPPPR
jgi:hypothetical protein